MFFGTRKMAPKSLWSDYGKSTTKRKWGEALSYFINHSGRMKYAWLKERHLPIGSGQVESAGPPGDQPALQSPGILLDN